MGRVSLAERRAFGRGRPVSAFTLGTMRAVEGPHQMAAVLEAALSAGINHLETAPAYGPAEAYLGQALAALAARDPGTRAGLVLTSKLLPGTDLAVAQQQLVDCLQRLGSPHLDNLAVHGLNRPEHLEWALRGPGSELLAWALGEGLTAQVGFSSHGSNGLIESALASERFSFCGLHVHLFDQTRLALARTALAEGLGVLAISPADKGGRLYSPPPELSAACAPFHPLELAYRFLLEAGISTLSLGAAQPSDLIWAKRWQAGELQGSAPALAAALQQLQQQAAQQLGSDLCGQCHACLPCPNAVPIPELLRLRNLAVGHGMEAFAQERYNLIGRAGHWWEAHNATACNRCGDCLPRCPHHLPIADLLADTHQRLAAAPQRRLWG